MMFDDDKVMVYGKAEVYECPRYTAPKREHLNREALTVSGEILSKAMVVFGIELMLYTLCHL